jgi:ubiquinone/menaquinone biosynthesis C-methylase UbiE
VPVFLTTLYHVVGCGNGKYLGVNARVFMVGSDICPELISIGCERGHEVLTCDCLNLPYRKNQFDCVICVAVIHHLSSEGRRLKALTEMARILHPGGEALIYVWAMEQERKKVNFFKTRCE